MKIFNIKNFTNGWFMGNFDPAILKTADFEIAHHFYEKGVTSDPHTHKVATEYNYIVNGHVKVDDQYFLNAGEFFVYEPNDVSNVEFLEDTNLIIIKTPSLPNDKYPVE